MQISKTSLPLLEELSNNPSFEHYIKRIKELILHRTIIRLSKVYTSISIRFFSTVICPAIFMDWKQVDNYFIVNIIQIG